MAVEAGDVAPDFTLPAVDHPPVALRDVLGSGQNALLVFLRYLG
jgi:peroxiredoxin